MSLRPSLYTIPAGFSFVDALARGIKDMADKAATFPLADYQILLPTRRACRSLRDAFLRQTNGAPLLLPRMHPIGEIDEDSLSLSTTPFLAEAENALLPEITPTRRLFLLTRLIQKQGKGRSITQNLELARALARLMDQTYTEDLDLADLPGLVDGTGFSNHWQVSLDFLSILSEHWPRILQSMGVMDAADRRNKLLKAMAQHWQQNPPAHPLLAAGSTGSIPATAQLLKTIATAPQGCVVLPALDQAMDEESWNAVEDTHPQATLKNLLGVMNVQRAEVDIWPVCEAHPGQKEPLRRFVSEIMRPAQTSGAWKDLGTQAFVKDLHLNMERYDCATSQEEALVAAMALRRVLEQPGKRAALVTPDRNLARRVASVCRRWNITVDDSAGTPLSKTLQGRFLRLAIHTVCADFAAVPLLDFCKHALCRPAREEWVQTIHDLDKEVLRGPVFGTGLLRYQKKCENLNNAKDAAKYVQTLQFIKTGFSPVLKLTNHDFTTQIPFHSLLQAHLQTVEYFADPQQLWMGEEGEAAARFFADLLQDAADMPDLALPDYLAVITSLMDAVSARHAYGTHPRVMILGQMEARLLEVDVMVLSGLNEGTWPQEPQPDPWMSRPMRKNFGLPSPERSIGLAAHDFVQGLCADEVVITRANRVDGTPTVPARWLSRMDTVLTAMGQSEGLPVGQRPSLLLQARQMDGAFFITANPVKRPAPKPPVHARPRKLSVTQIETWTKDPYSIYAKHILKLAPLKPLDEPFGAAQRGTFLHDVLQSFYTQHRDGLPADVAGAFYATAKAAMEAADLDIATQILWEPRLRKIGEWLGQREAERKHAFTPLMSEAAGAIRLPAAAGGFTLTCRIDRADISRDGKEGSVIDYKSGGGYTQNAMANGDSPQLPLEALIWQEGGFSGQKAVPVTELAYWVLKGTKSGDKAIALSDAAKVSEVVAHTRDGLIALIDQFDDPETCYLSLPKPHKIPKYNDYEHLARVKEWTALDDTEFDQDEESAA
jgi:ATP-dependent helicase/nuclease subunit B